MHRQLAMLRGILRSVRLRASVEARLIYDPKRNYERRWTMIYRPANKLRTTPWPGKGRESLAELTRELGRARTLPIAFPPRLTIDTRVSPKVDATRFANSSALALSRTTK